MTSSSPIQLRPTGPTTPRTLYATSPRSPLSAPPSSPFSEHRHHQYHHPTTPTISLNPPLPASHLPSFKSNTTPPLSTSTSSSTSLPRRGLAHSLVGSWETSLLRMATAPALSYPFKCSIGVLSSPPPPSSGASGDTPITRWCPDHLHVIFGAAFYDEKEAEEQGSSGRKRRRPYVAAIDLEEHFLRSLALYPSTVSTTPKFPGYRVPKKGLLQLKIRHSVAADAAAGGAGSMVKLFLIPYDLTGLDRDGIGGRTFMRQKIYVDEGGEGGSKGILRDAIHLQFCSPPTSSSASSPVYYLHSTIRLVFGSSPLDPTALATSEKIRTVIESPKEEIASYAGPSPMWIMMKKKASARRKVLDSAFARLEITSSSSSSALVASPPLPFITLPLPPLSGLSTSRPPSRLADFDTKMGRSKREEEERGD